MKLTFLARFTLVTIAGALVSAGILAYVLDVSHLRAVQNDLVANAVGQTSSALTAPISRLDIGRKRCDRQTYGAIAQQANQQSSLQEYVRGLRVYWTNGSPLYPKGVPPAHRAVRAAIAAQDVWRSPMHRSHGEWVFTEYVPLADPRSNDYGAVAAIDFSVEQIRSQSASEHRLVFSATLGAIGLLVGSLLTLAYGAQRELDRRERIVNQTFIQTMEGVASIVDKRDPYTAGHSRRVATYSHRLATALRLPAEDCRTVEQAALLHDLGKIGIPDAVLLKNAKLTDHERTIIQFHPDIACDILRNIEAMREVVPCIVHHHERWDGTGYPRRLVAHSIPLGARIIAVADAYDAMTTDRPYRRALSVEIARSRLIEAAGSQFDADCVAAFVRIIDAGDAVPPTPATDLNALARSFGQQLHSQNLS